MGANLVMGKRMRQGKCLQYKAGNILKFWQHSGNKCWNCIDYVIVCWNKCIDGCVRTGAKYNTDPLLVY